MAGVLVLVGAVAGYFALRPAPESVRAVAGAPGAPAPAAQGNADGGLPSGHPSIELPQEVVEFLDGLAAAAAKDPTNVEAAQKLARARYRASVINASYRAAAQQSLDSLMKLDPRNDEGMRISASLAYDAGDFPEAAKRFEAFLERNPDDTGALTDLGSALLFQDKPDLAITAYQAALNKDPNFMQAHFNMGIAYQKQGNKDASIASLKRAMESATAPEERQHIENALAEVEGRQPAQLAGGSPPAASQGAVGGGQQTGSPGAAGASAQPNTQGGMPMPPPAPDRSVPTNASTDFQRQAEKPLITHPIVGPRVVSFEWTGPSSGKVKIADFPMDQMPPFARTKFKSGMAEKLGAIAASTGVSDPVTVEMIDNGSGRVMDTLGTDQ